MLHHFAGPVPPAFPERIFGPEHVSRHPDGSADFVGIPESKLRDKLCPACL